MRRRRIGRGRLRGPTTSITEFSELVDVLMHTGDWVLFDFVTDNYGVVQNYLMSIRKRAQE